MRNSMSIALIVAVATCGRAQDEKSSPRIVPLNEIYSNSSQKGLKRLTATPIGKGAQKIYKEPYGAILEVLRERVSDGASTIFLDEAASLERILSRSAARIADGPLVIPKSPFPFQKEVAKPPTMWWLVAYLGKGPAEEPAWIVTSVEVATEKIRVSYKKQKAEGKEIIPYFYCLALKNLEPGEYRLELFDADQKSVTMSDRYPVTAPKQALPQRAVPLASIHGTSGQEGITEIRPGGKPKPGVKPNTQEAALTELIRRERIELRLMLCRGDDIASAVFGSYAVRFEGRSTDLAVSADPDSKSKNYWLATQFPWGVGGPRFFVKSVTIHGKTIRWSYQEGRTPGATGQVNVPHFFWAPLGNLDAGDYELELFDLGTNQVEMTRRVRVP